MILEGKESITVMEKDTREVLAVISNEDIVCKKNIDILVTDSEGKVK